MAKCHCYFALIVAQSCHVYRIGPQPKLAARDPAARELSRRRQDQEAHHRQPVRLADRDRRRTAHPAQGRQGGAGRSGKHHRAPRVHAPHQANSDPAARLRAPRRQPGSYPVKRPALATNSSELIALSIQKKEVRASCACPRGMVQVERVCSRRCVNLCYPIRTERTCSISATMKSKNALMRGMCRRSGWVSRYIGEYNPGSGPRTRSSSVSLIANGIGRGAKPAPDLTLMSNPGTVLLRATILAEGATDRSHLAA